MNQTYYNKKSNDLDNIDMPDNPTIISKPIAFNHELFLTDEIQAPCCYNSWISAIQNAGPGDIITIHINSPGGYLDTGIQLYGALISSKATIKVLVEGGCCSAATMVMMAADELYIDANAYFMFHAYTGGRVGKFNSLQEDAKFQEKWFPAISKEIYQDFLTETELNDLLSGKDFWLDATDVQTRYERLMKRRQLEMIKRDPNAAMKLAAMGINIKDLEAELKEDLEEPKVEVKAEAKSKRKAPAKKPIKENTNTKKPSEKKTKAKTPSKKQPKLIPVDKKSN